MPRLGIYAPGSFNGNYVPQGDPLYGDCWLGIQYGEQAGVFWGLVNEASAAYIARHAPRYVPYLLAPNIGRPLVAKFGGQTPALTFRDETSGLVTTQEVRGTKSELKQAFDYMREHDLHAPVLVGEAHHIGRAALQAEKLAQAENFDVDIIVPPGLHKGFDPSSAQPWTGGPVAWAVREAVGVPVLRLTGRF